jgi:hypothetical protein
MKMERAALPCVRCTDDLFYGADTKKLLVSGDSSYIDIFKQSNENDYSATAHIPSWKWARTSLWIPSTRQLELPVLKGCRIKNL